jgi:hypothetical protein
MRYWTSVFHKQCRIRRPPTTLHFPICSAGSCSDVFSMTTLQFLVSSSSDATEPFMRSGIHRGSSWNLSPPDLWNLRQRVLDGYIMELLLTLLDSSSMRYRTGRSQELGGAMLRLLRSSNRWRFFLDYGTNIRGPSCYCVGRSLWNVDGGSPMEDLVHLRRRLWFCSHGSSHGLRRAETLRKPPA